MLESAALVRGSSLPLAPSLLLGQNLYSRYSTKNACVHAQLLSHVQLCVTPWTVAHQPPLSLGFSRQEYWSGLPCPPPGDLPNSGILCFLHWQADSLPLATPGEPIHAGCGGSKKLPMNWRQSDPDAQEAEDVAAPGRGLWEGSP